MLHRRHKMALVGVCLLSSQAMGIDSLKLSNIRGVIQQGSGELSFDEVKIQQGDLLVSSEFSVIELNFESSQFNAQYEGVNLNYSTHEDSIISGISTIQTDFLDVDYQKGSNLSLSTNGLYIAHSGGQQEIPQFSLSCRQQSQSLLEDIAHQCLSLARLEIPEVQLDSLSGQAVAKALTEISSVDTIDDISLFVNEGAYQLSLKIKYLFNWKVKSTGTVSFNEETGVVKIYVAKAKVGFLSVRSKLLKELRNANLSSVTVDGNNILIQI